MHLCLYRLLNAGKPLHEQGRGESSPLFKSWAKGDGDIPINARFAHGAMNVV